MNHCEQLTDRALAALAQGGSPTLRELSITGCVQLSDRGLQALGALGGQLVVLVAKGCPAMTAAGVAVLKQQCPNIRRAIISPKRHDAEAVEPSAPPLEQDPWSKGVLFPAIPKRLSLTNMHLVDKSRAQQRPATHHVHSGHPDRATRAPRAVTAHGGSERRQRRHGHSRGSAAPGRFGAKGEPAVLPSFRYMGAGFCSRVPITWKTPGRSAPPRTCATR